MTPYTNGPTTLTAEERERLILEHLPQVHLIATRIYERAPDRLCLEDLISTGIVGLISAIDNFDPSQGVKLKTYAEYKIRGAILDSLRKMDWAPRQRRKRSREIEEAIRRAEQRLQRPPSDEEIAAELNISLEEYHQWLAGIQGLQLASLEYVPADGEGVELLRLIADDEEKSPESVVERSELERLLSRAIEELPENERLVLSLYYVEELTLQEIGEILQLHPSRISQLKSQAILRLRTKLQASWPARGGFRRASAPLKDRIKARVDSAEVKASS